VNAFVLAAIVLVVFFGFVYWLDRRTKAKGSLFMGRPTMTMRILALILAIVFGGAFVVEILSMDEFHVVLPILAIAALAYSLGATQLLAGIQAASEEESRDETVEYHHE